MRPARLLVPLSLLAACVALLLVISSSRSATGPAPIPAAELSSTGTAATAPAASRLYTVVPGDTPSGIATRERVSLSALLTANGITDAGALRVGQRLKLPG